MNKLIKEIVEQRLYENLKDSNRSKRRNEELSYLTNLYSELKKSNYRNITFTDFIPSVSLICITAILITILIMLM